MATPPKQVEIELSFPLQGKVEEVAYSKQPPQTYVDGLNVVPFDTLEDRSRGGQRWGVSKYDDTAINGTNFIQRIDTTVRAVGVLEASPGNNLFGSPFIFDQAEGTIVAGSTWQEYGPVFAGESGFEFPLDLGQERADGGANERAFIHNGSNRLAIRGDRLGDNLTSGRIMGNQGGTRRPGSTEALDADHIDFIQRITINTGSAFTTDNNAQYFMGLIYRGRMESAGSPNTDNEYFAVLWHREAGTQTQRIILIDEDNTVLAVQTAGPMSSAPDTGAHLLEMRIVGDQITVLWDSIFVFNFNISGQGHNSVTGTIAENAWTGIMYVRQRDSGTWDAGNAEGTFGNWEIFGGAVTVGDVERNLIVVSGGSVFAGRPSAGGFTAAPGGSGVIDAASFEVDSIFAFNNLFLIDGRTYQRFDQASGSVVDWDSTAGTPVVVLPGGQGSSAAADDVPRCRIIELHQGRLYMAGKEDDPTNLFASALNAPFNWDTSATATGSAIDFGSLSDVGVPGDIITAIIPHINRRLILGTDSSIHVITGDPGPGNTDGQRLAISRGIGISGSQAWTISPDQTIYFMANDGIYRLAANEFNIDKNNKFSTGRIDRTIRNIDLRTNKIHLEWSIVFDGLFIFITPTIQGPTTHFFWDRRTASFHPFQMPDGFGPTAVLAFENASPISDEGFLLGGFDSFIREFDKAATQDDGTAISSNVLIGPILSPFAGKEIRISNMRAILDEQSGPISFEIRAADTPEQAVTATPVFSGTWTAGRNAPSWDRARGAAIYLRLSQSTLGQTWSMESVTARITEAGPTRPR